MAKKRPSKKRVVKKHHHPLLVFFIIVGLLFIISFSFGSFKETLNSKKVAGDLIVEGNYELALSYCNKMEFRNFECYAMYLDQVSDYDKSICSNINVGKLQFWTTKEMELDLFKEFRKVKERCLA